MSLYKLVWPKLLPTTHTINYSLFALSLPPEVHNSTLLHGSQRSYGLKTITIGTATRIEVKQHLNRPDPILYRKVILVVGKKHVARSMRIDYTLLKMGSYSSTTMCQYWDNF